MREKRRRTTLKHPSIDYLIRFVLWKSIFSKVITNAWLMAGARECDDDGCDVSDAGHNDEERRGPGDAYPDTDLSDTRPQQRLLSCENLEDFLKIIFCWFGFSLDVN